MGRKRAVRDTDAEATLRRLAGQALKHYVLLLRVCKSVTLTYYACCSRGVYISHRTTRNKERRVGADERGVDREVAIKTKGRTEAQEQDERDAIMATTFC